MEIITTRDEFKEFTKDAKTVGNITIHRKRDSSFLHNGHKYAVQYSKDNFDLTIVSFRNHSEIIWALYDDDKAKSYSQSVFNWDKEGCLKWCEDNEINAVIIPPNQATFDVHRTEEMKLIKEKAEEIIKERNYPIYDQETHPIHYYIMLLYKSTLISHLSPANDNTIAITSWKSGILSLIVNDFNNLGTKNKIVVLDPLLTDDDIPESKTIKQLTDSQIKLIKTIPSIIEQDENNKKDENFLLNNLKKIESTIINGDEYFSGIEVKEVSIINNGIAGEGRIFISIFYKVNNKLHKTFYHSKGGV